MAYKGVANKTPLGRDRQLSPQSFKEQPAFDWVDSVPMDLKRGERVAQAPELSDKGKRPPFQEKPFKVKGK